MDDIAIKLANVNKSYRLYDRNALDRFRDTFLPGNRTRHREFSALKNVNIEIKKGEVVGIVGRNGAGKSTLLKIISGISQATSGIVETSGRIVPLLELGGGFNPDYTGRENIYFNCSLQGMRRDEIDKIFDDVVAFSELADFIDIPVRKYSSGMKARLGFAVSTNINPEILILDEVLSVGDELFRRKCFARMEEFFRSDKTIIFVSHALNNVAEICTRSILLHNGELLLSADNNTIISRYRKLMSVGGIKEKEVVEEIKKLDADSKMKSVLVTRYERRQLENSVSMSTIQDINHVQAKSYFLEDFISKSQSLKALKDISFSTVSIFNTNGEECNHLAGDEEFRLTFKVHFNEDVSCVSIGVNAYSNRGKALSGLWIPGKFESVDDVSEGSIIEVNIPFRTTFLSGLYGIRIIVRGLLDNEITSVANISDAIVFRILEKNELDLSGHTRFFHGGSYAKIQ